MPAPIRKLYIVRRYTEAYYRLSPSELDAVAGTIFPVDTEVGGRAVLTCKSRWCSEAVAVWGVMDYPNIQAVQQATDIFEKRNSFRYAETETYLGAGGESFAESVDIPDAIYQLFMIRNVNNEPWAALSKEKQDEIFGCMTESIEKHGGKPMFWSSISWSNEEYENFGVIAWPDVEAVQGHFAVLDEIGWHRYHYARTILGMKV